VIKQADTNNSSRYRRLRLVFFCVFLSGALVSTTVNAQSQQVKSFTLTSIYFNKVALIESVELLPVYEAFLGARITLATLKDICNQITSFYHERGHRQAKCLIPAQTIRSGVVKMEIEEGIIDSVRLSGDVDGEETLLNDYLSHITPGQSLDTNELNYVRRLIAALPGTTVRVYTQPSPNTANLELIFEVQRVAYNGEVFVNNRGSKLVGPVQAGLTVSSHSLLGFNEMLQVSLVTAEQTDELKFLELRSSWPTTAAGSYLLLEASLADSVPGDFLAPSDVDVMVYAGRAGWSSPLLLSEKESLYASAWVDYFKSETDIGGTLITFDEIYKLKLSTVHSIDETRYSLLSSIEYSHGLSGLNTNAVNVDGLVSLGNEDFDHIGYDVLYRVLLSSKILLTLHSKGQYAFSDLPVSEYITFGGEIMGSAYDPAEFFGDHGLGAKSRLGYLLSTYNQFYIQYDIVKVWNEALDFDSTGASLATGVTYGSPHYSMDFQIASPLTKDVFLEGDDDIRFFASLRYMF